MPTVKVTQSETDMMEEEAGTVKVSVSPPKVQVMVDDPTKHVTKFKLNFRRALNGDYMIFEHADIDIIIMPEKKKVVAFAKDMMSDIVYGAENRLFEHLKKTGIVAFDSIQGGNVYGSLEGLILEAKEGIKNDSIDYLLYQISEWIKLEKPHTDAIEAHGEMLDDAMLDPDDEYSTELGEVPHEEDKGSIKQSSMWEPYYYGRWTY